MEILIECATNNYILPGICRTNAALSLYSIFTIDITNNIYETDNKIKSIFDVIDP